jgi:8-oxo-dGTP pyrophosphatase MutT (NUDIX family)
LSYTLNLIATMESQYGIPDELSYVQDVDEREFDRIAQSMRDKRVHDITLFIAKDDGYIFIAKHSYPPGLFRAPSGGLHKDEDFETGAKREALEETGVEIEIGTYLLRINVRFQNGEKHIDWVSHVFTACHVSGEISPRDTNEIHEACLVTLDEIPIFQEIMRNSKVGGFQYRAYLMDEVLKRV